MMRNRLENIKYPISNVKCQIVVGLVLVAFIFVNPAFAATSTDSAQSSPQASASASLLDKLNQIKTIAASKAADLLTDITKKMQNKAFIGLISSVDTDSISVSYLGEDHVIKTNEYTDFTVGKVKKPTIKDLSTGDFVSGLGDVDDTGNLQAKKVIKSTPIASDSSRLVWGKVTKVQGGLITVKLADTTSKTITATGNTEVFDGSDEATLSTIAATKTIIARGKESADGILSATYIYIVPQATGVVPQKTALPAASASASPAAKSKK